SLVVVGHVHPLVVVGGRACVRARAARGARTRAMRRGRPAVRLALLRGPPRPPVPPAAGAPAGGPRRGRAADARRRRPGPAPGRGGGGGGGGGGEDGFDDRR